MDDYTIIDKGLQIEKGLHKTYVRMLHMERYKNKKRHNNIKKHAYMYHTGSR